MRQGRKFRIGHLFFKYVQGTPLERSKFNTSKILGAELHARGLIELYRERESGELETVDRVERATWYGYSRAGERTPKEIETMFLKGAA
jgi:hypothetical protein